MTICLAEVVFKCFVNRVDCHCLQKNDGSYVKVEQPLMLDVLQDHLTGMLTVGAYQLGLDNTVKYVCFDLDPERLSDPEAAARKILQTCFQKKREGDVERPRIWPHAVLLEASRYPDPSYHVWVLFNVPTYAKVARWLGMRILELAGLNPREIELFPKQTELTPERPYGNFVKLPLGKHQAAGKWSRLLDPETFQPLPNETLLECFGISFSEADTAKIMSFKAEKLVQVPLKLHEFMVSLPNEEEERAAQFLARYWVKGRRNQLEMAFLGFCIKRGIAYESARRIIERVCDLTRDEERAARLALVDYHYKNRVSLGSALAGVSLIREVIREVVK
ncbi:hypothetical protein KEJ24_06050 [Candidatus Bathyarchaeota archaeon]|nr:hypothetical protein [Candidatus Bathyarchaeota archaeon]